MNKVFIIGILLSLCSISTNAQIFKDDSSIYGVDVPTAAQIGFTSTPNAKGVNSKTLFHANAAYPWICSTKYFQAGSAVNYTARTDGSIFTGVKLTPADVAIIPLSLGDDLFRVSIGSETSYLLNNHRHRSNSWVTSPYAKINFAGFTVKTAYDFDLKHKENQFNIQVSFPILLFVAVGALFTGSGYN